MNKSIFCFLICWLSFSSCTVSYPPGEYVEKTDTDCKKYCKNIERNGAAIQIYMKPYEYFAARDMVADPKLTKDSAIEKYKNSLFIIATVSMAGAFNSNSLITRGTDIDFSDNLMRYSFLVGGDVFMYSESDTVRFVDYQYERSWGIGNGDAFVFLFSRQTIKRKLNDYKFVMRNIAAQLGTIELEVKDLKQPIKQLKG